MSPRCDAAFHKSIPAEPLMMAPTVIEITSSMSVKARSAGSARLRNRARLTAGIARPTSFDLNAGIHFIA